VALFGFKQFPNNTYDLFVEKITQIGGIYSKLEALMAVTQLSWESAGFTATASWACSKAYDKIEYWEVQEKCESYDKKGIQVIHLELEFQVCFLDSNFQKIVQKLRIITGEVTHRSKIAITIDQPQ